MKTYYLNKLSPEELARLTKRPAINLDKIIEVVKPVLSSIKAHGLAAALKYAKEFDGFGSEEVKVSKSEFDEAEKKLPGEIKSAIITAFKKIVPGNSEQLKMLGFIYPAAVQYFLQLC
jgi:histidinol dehydrogenase